MCKQVALFLVIGVFCFNYQTEASCPSVISRQVWGARAPKTPAATNRRDLPLAIVHHSASDPCDTREDCYESIRFFQRFHIEERNWDDIGYNFLISSNGEVYEGRGWGKRGAHAPRYNSLSLGVCIIGNYKTGTPSSASIAALWNLLDCAVTKGHLSSTYKVIGHKQAKPSTDCPGENLYSELKKSSRWTSNPGRGVGGRN